MYGLYLNDTKLTIHDVYNSGRAVCSCPNPNHSIHNRNGVVFVDPIVAKERGIVYYCYSCKMICKTYKDFKKKMLEFEININIGKFRDLEGVKEIKNHDEKIFDMMNQPLAIDNKYLLSRGVTNEQVDFYQIREGSGKIIFPRFDSDNKLIGVTVRFTHESSYVRYIDYGGIKIPFGIDKLDAKLNEVYICEGIFGVLNLNRFNKQAIGILGNSNYNYRMIQNNYDNVFVCVDNDEAGFNTANKIKKFLPLAKILKPNEFDEINKTDFLISVDEASIFISEFTY